MTSDDILDALMARLEGAAGLPAIVWVNDDSEALDPPFLELQFFPQQTRTVRFPATQELRGFLQVGVMAKEGTYLAYKDITDALVDLFPAGLRLAADDGHFTIMHAPTVRGGLADRNAWKVPVDIYYRGFSK